MKCINQVQLIGSMGQDPETKFTANNKAVTTFSLATTSSYKDKNGEWQSETQWHNIVAWSVSDWVKEQLGKGVRLYIEGSLKYEQYEKDGVKKYITKIIATNIIPLTKNEKVEAVEVEEIGDEEIPF